MSGILEEFKNEEDNLKNYQQAVKEIDQILTDRNNWDAGKICFLALVYQLEKLIHYRLRHHFSNTMNQIFWSP